MKRLGRMITVLATCIVTVLAFGAVMELTGAVSDTFSKICLVAIILIGAWICSKD
jgi:hypothetical protein